MRSTRLHSLSFALLSLGLTLVAGCNPPPPPNDCESDGSCPACEVGDESDECIEPTVCDQEPCRYVFSCIAPAPAPTASNPDPDPLRLCNGNTLAMQDGYRTMCEYSQQAADAFCLSECMTAGAQNGYTLQETMVLCQNSTAMPELWYVNDEQVVCKNAPPGNIPFSYKPEEVCPAADGADPNAPEPTVEPDEDLDHIFCHGTAQPSSAPASADPYTFPNATQLNYWLETWELDEWHATPGYVGYDTNCGFKVYRILYELSGLNDDQICQASCAERVAALELDAQNQNPNDPEAARILHDNCDSFIAETMCNQAGPPPLVGPITVPLTLAASLQQGSTYTTTSFSGTLTYSTYDCAPGTPNCGIVINNVSLDMTYPVSGTWQSSSTSPGTPFSSSNLSLDIPRPASGAYSLVTNAFSLDPFTVPLHVEGALTVGRPGSTGSLQSIDIDTTNTDAISGTIESDGSVTLYGSFDFGPGVALHFGTPGPM
ncbi:hypothetical protein [Polyangium mundeleinium]|uniref:Lipoprotein n=1 Tax=Polyangium mundeleinium TaxID=2995306 RepID=A0ABT5EJB8_9BACT|nr:hypothetical protein [Polyangium mundeleinium]MDC0741564.1 hypothetical protein [Polyangium mundeleinium]